VVLALIGLVLLAGLVAVGHQQASAHRRILVGALTSQLDGHALKIEMLLSTMRTNDIPDIEEAIYRELQVIPCTSLISRSDVWVLGTHTGLQCVIDTSKYRVPPRIIKESKQQDASP
jgi:hypothetical protein